MKYSQYKAKRPEREEPRPAVFSRPADMPQARPAPAARPKDDQAVADRAFYVITLASEECLCGKPKRKGYSFCVHDYMALPSDMKKLLFQRIGEGYAEAFEAAHKWLTENIW